MDTRNQKISRLSKETTGFINTHSKKGLSQAVRLQNAWEKIASSQALEHTDNITFSNRLNKSTLLVYVDSSHWAAELESQKELYRILIEKETGYRVADLKFLVTRKTAFKKAFIKWRETTTSSKGKEGSVPLTDEEEGYARKMVSVIKSEKLREQLFKAMKADFEWKKGTEGLKLPENPPEGSETI